MPRPPVTRAERKLETRAAIVDAAARSFARKGIDASSIDAIAASIGLTKGAVYASFGSKHELIKAVAERHSAAADVMPLLRTDLPLVDRLRLFGRGLTASLEGASNELMLLDFEYAVYAKRNKRWRLFLRDTRKVGLKELAARFDAVNAERGERLPLPTEAFLSVLTAAVRGVVQQYALEPDSIRGPAIETLFALLAGQPASLRHHR
ncbi:MAG: TetR family transcriptional regulator [Gemmatimonadaceae bacterium]